MAILGDRYVVITGDRDGASGPAIEECTKIAGAKIAYSSTECFVWMSADAMDLENQKRVLNINGERDPKNIAALLGAAEVEAAGLAAETVTAGDPTYADSLAGVQLGLGVYHICEDEVKAETDPVVYEEQVGMTEMVMDVPAIHKEVEDIRKEYCRY